VRESRSKTWVSRLPLAQQRAASTVTQAPHLLKVTTRKKAAISKKSKHVKAVKTKKINNEDKPNKRSRKE
jgi:hypothetical protein